MAIDIAKPTADFVTSTLSGALAAGATTATIDSGLSLAATNGVLHLDYDSTGAVGTDNGPETVTYATYTTGTGALAGLVRGAAGTTDVAHANGATVSAGISVEHLNEYDRKNASDQTIIGKNDTRAVRYVPIVPTELVNLDPTVTDWIDVDVTANTSANCYAVTGTVALTCGGTQRGVGMRKNGSADTAASTTRKVSAAASTYGYTSYIQEVDTGQIFEYSASGVDITNITISINGYFEYVD